MRLCKKSDKYEVWYYDYNAGDDNPYVCDDEEYYDDYDYGYDDDHYPHHDNCFKEPCPIPLPWGSAFGWPAAQVSFFYFHFWILLFFALHVLLPSVTFTFFALRFLLPV